MDHYAPTHDLDARRGGRGRWSCPAIAAVELVALVALGVVLLGKGWFQHARASAVAQRDTHDAAARRDEDAREARRPA